MQIHVARHQQQLGVFAAEDIAAGLSSGRFHASDLAWREGMAAWTPLGDWAEFRGVGVPAAVTSMPFSMPAEPASASLIPWEQGKSLGSFFATIKQAIVSPTSLATGRFAFGDWLAFCYLAVAFSLPFQLINVIVFGDKNAQMAEWLRSLNIPELSKAADQLATAQPAPVWITVFGALMGLAFAPLGYAFSGLLHWIGQCVFRYQVPAERTVSATLLGMALLALVMAPLQLLGFNFAFQMGLSALFFIPACVIYYRAFGAATGVNPWVQFGISCFVWFVLCCCCFVAPVTLFIWSLAGRSGMSFGG
jgi:hypothetical protein